MGHALKALSVEYTVDTLSVNVQFPSRAYVQAASERPWGFSQQGGALIMLYLYNQYRMQLFIDQPNASVCSF